MRNNSHGHSSLLSLWSVYGLCAWLCVCTTPGWGNQHDTTGIQTIKKDIERVQSQVQTNPDDPHVLTKLAGLYLKLGRMEYNSDERRVSLHEQGVHAAKQALTIQEDLADAHFYYAANLGSATQLKGVMASALVVDDLKLHVKRALQLKSDHAPALHMFGRMLDELPWLLGGDQDAALEYLKKAVAADEHDTHARLDLAKLYLKRQNITAAIRELKNILQRKPRNQNWSWQDRHILEAKNLLKQLSE